MALLQNVVRRRRGRPIRAFYHHACLDAVSVVHRDLLLQRRRNQNFAVHIPELVVWQRFGFLKAGHRACGGHMPQQRRHVQPGLAIDSAAMVLHCHDARTGLGKQLG